MKTKRLLKYQSLALVTGLAVFAALCAMPETAHGQAPTPGNLFVSVNLGGSLRGGSSIFQYTPAGAQSTFGPTLDTPRGLAFDCAGNLFVATNSSVDHSLIDVQGTLLKIAPDGTPTTFATGFGSGFTLEGLAIDSAGNVFVAGQKFDNTTSIIYKVTPDGAVSTFGSVPGQCFGLAIDSAGDVFAAGASDSTNTYGSIYEFTSEGVRSIFAGPAAFTSPQGPIGLAFDRFGNLFVSTSDGNTPSTGVILKFTPDGTETTFAPGPLTNQPRGLAFDGAGNLFVAEVPGNTTGDILEFSPGGTETVFASGIGPAGNRGAEFLTFAPGSFAAHVQQPINSDGASVFNANRGVVPVKFTLTQDCTATCTLPTATIAVTRTAGGTIGAIDESVYSGAADTGSNFRISSCQYVYNLNSGALGVGTYRVDIEIGGMVVGSATFGLR